MCLFHPHPFLLQYQYGLAKFYSLDLFEKYLIDPNYNFEINYKKKKRVQNSSECQSIPEDLGRSFTEANFSHDSNHITKSTMHP